MYLFMILNIHCKIYIASMAVACLPHAIFHKPHAPDNWKSWHKTTTMMVIHFPFINRGFQFNCDSPLFKIDMT